MNRREFLRMLGWTAVAVVLVEAPRPPQPVLVEEPKREFRPVNGGRPTFFDVSFVYEPYVPAAKIHKVG